MPPTQPMVCQRSSLCCGRVMQVRDNVWILKDPRRRFKGNAMFPPVDAILVLIPGETMLYILNYSTLWARASFVRTLVGDGIAAPVRGFLKGRLYAAILSLGCATST